MTRIPRTSKKGFTLIEMLVVIAIIALLSSLLLPVVGKARAKAMRVTTMSNLRQISLAMQMYSSDNKGLFPTGYIAADASAGTKMENWMQALTEREYLGKEDRNASANELQYYEYTVMGSPLQRRENKNMPKWDWATFSANAAVLGINKKPIYQDMIKTPSSTLLISEGSTHGNTSTYRFNAMFYGQQQRTMPDYLYDGKVTCLFADWHIETIALKDFPAFSDIQEGNEAWAFWRGM